MAARTTRGRDRFGWFSFLHVGRPSNKVCPLGWYGPSCQHPCMCESLCRYDPKTGDCNLTSTVQDILSQVGQCLAPSMVRKRNEEHLYFTKTAWLSLTLALGLLLLLSAAANVTFVLGSRASRRHLDGEYAYHPLQEMNGELQSLEKEPQGDPTLSIKDSKQ